MIKEIDNPHGHINFNCKYSYEFRTNCPLDSEYTDKHAEIIIEALLTEFETELRLKLGYVLESKWIKK